MCAYVCKRVLSLSFSAVSGKPTPYLSRTWCQSHAFLWRPHRHVTWKQSARVSAAEILNISLCVCVKTWMQIGTRLIFVCRSCRSCGGGRSGGELGQHIGGRHGEWLEFFHSKSVEMLQVTKRLFMQRNTAVEYKKIDVKCGREWGGLQGSFSLFRCIFNQHPTLNEINRIMESHYDSPHYQNERGHVRNAITLVSLCLHTHRIRPAMWSEAESHQTSFPFEMTQQHRRFVTKLQFSAGIFRIRTHKLRRMGEGMMGCWFWFFFAQSQTTERTLSNVIKSAFCSGSTNWIQKRLSWCCVSSCLQGTRVTFNLDPRIVGGIKKNKQKRLMIPDEVNSSWHYVVLQSCRLLHSERSSAASSRSWRV